MAAADGPFLPDTPLPGRPLPSSAPFIDFQVANMMMREPLRALMASLR
jgi:hypothetical protein